jgi:hypothetical protein
MKPMDDDEYEKVESLGIAIGGIALLCVFVVVAVFAAPYLDQFFRWADGR